MQTTDAVFTAALAAGFFASVAAAPHPGFVCMEPCLYAPGYNFRYAAFRSTLRR